MDITLQKRNKYYFIFDIIITVIFGLAFFIALGLFTFSSKRWGVFATREETFPIASVVNCCADLCAIIVGAVLYFDLAFIAKYKTRETRIFMAVIVVIVYNLICDSVAWSVEGLPLFKWANYLVDSIYYFNGYLILLLFFLYSSELIKDKGKTEKVLLFTIVFLLIIMTIITIINLFNGMLFSIDDLNHYHRGKYYDLTTAYFLIGYALNIVIIIKAKLKLKNLVAYLIYALLPFILNVINLFPVVKGLSLVYAAAMGSVLILFVIVQGERERDKEKAELELSNMKVINIMSQIQPHFIYNVLTSIYYLVDNEPERAKEAIDTFSRYLRSTIDADAAPRLITLNEEIKYCKLYLGLEKLRYEERLNVEFDIQDDSFMIPRFGVQPLVENAVKHGISKNKNGGTVTISSRTDDKYNYVIVQDTGVGFDTTKPFNEDSNHIGVENIKFRLQRFVDGELSIDSAPGEGTVCTIRIPKKES